jgi:adenine-specific DNA-methyltransferase
LGPEPDSAAPLVNALGMRHIRTAVDMVGKFGPPSELKEQLPDYVGAFYRVGEADLSDGSTVGVYLVPLREWAPRSSDRERYRRKVAKALVEHQQQDARWLAILLDPRGKSREAEFVMPRVRPGAGVGTVRASVNLREPNRYHCELLEAMTVRSGASLGAIVKQWNEAFSVERVTKRFYEEFRVLRDQLIDALLEYNADNPALKGRDRKTNKEFDLQLHAYGTRQLGRLLFAWFLQQKRWLGNSAGDGDPEFLLKLFAAKREEPDSFFNDALVPLFLDGLGLPLRDSAHEAVEERLGSIPYLGGALFRAGADDFEAALMNFEGDDLRPTRRIMLPDSLFDPTQDQPATSITKSSAQRTILGLLRGYRFTTQESTPDDQSVDPDPELLGKVFENLYQADERHQTGAYYTPREIVHYMCRQALDGYLTERTGISQEDIDWIRLEAADWTISDRRLDAVVAERVHQALADVKILDPAVGSGAFLLASIHEITLLRRGIWQSEHDDFLDRGSQEMADYKRHAATNCVYGVDINPMAVEICQLRLLLSIVVDLDISDYREVPTLPNLDFRVVAGDSLIDRMGENPFLQSLPPPLGVQFDFELTKKIGDLQKRIDKWRGEFSGEGAERKDAARLRDLAQQIRAAQVEIARTQLDGEVEDSRARLKKLAMSGKATKKTVRSLEEHVSGLERLAEGLHERAAYQKPFLWPVNFHEVLEAGGFDIVLANPPYVRQEKLDAIDQISYEHAFAEVHSGMADLLVYFYSRAVQVLRDGGQIAFITSSSFVKRAYGLPLCEFLCRCLVIRTVIDFGETPIFDATVEPYVLVGQKRPPDYSHEVDGHYLFAEIARRAGTRSSVAAARAEIEDLYYLLREDHVRIPQSLFCESGWAIERAETIQLYTRLMSQGTPLGDYVRGRMYYGIKTGLNGAFVIGEQERNDLISSDARSAEVIEPWLRGKDIKRWRAEWTGLYVIAIQSSGDSDASNAWGQANNETEARRIFKGEYPAVHDHLSSYERKLRSRADQGRWWWELRACAYYAEFKRSKVMWPEFARRVRFCAADSGVMANNKCYIWAEAPAWSLAILNSELIEFILCQITKQVRGGFLQLYDHFVRRLPLVVPDDKLATQLSELAAEMVNDPTDQGVEAQIEESVRRLYGIRDKDATVIDDWFASRSVIVPAEEDNDVD